MPERQNTRLWLGWFGALACAAAALVAGLAQVDGRAESASVDARLVAAAPVEAMGSADAPHVTPENMPSGVQPLEIELPAPGDTLPDPVASFCDERHWKRTGLALDPGDAGEFRVDAREWKRRSTSARVGLASWISQCREDGGAVVIVDRDGGARLAVYDPRGGLRSLRP